MPKTAKIAISLPEDFLDAIEEERKATGESRSQFFRRAIESYWQRTKERLAVEQYLEGYRKTPESLEEVEAVHRAGAAILAEEPWD
ncbi:MAG: ribbon-helix-helix domain-containing protein [Dehalococcoidia bacterium]|nr:ribbon-helix-helix domain-containing protein [Dehalococcoidia bacterium]